MEGLAKFFKHDFDSGSFELFDKNNNRIYYEDLNGFWAKCKFDENNNRIYFECSNRFWIKREYDENNYRIYYENSDGDIEDNRPTCSGKIVEIDGKKYKLEEI